MTSQIYLTAVVAFLSIGCAGSERRSPGKKEVIAAMQAAAPDVSRCYGPEPFQVKAVFDGDSGSLTEVEEVTTNGRALTDQEEACVRSALVGKVSVGSFHRNKHLLDNGVFRVVYPFRQK